MMSTRKWWPFLSKWLDFSKCSGTLLGFVRFVRDCKLKPDIDFVIPHEWWRDSQNQKALGKTLVSAGLRATWGKQHLSFGEMGKVGCEEAWQKNQVKVDLFSIVEKPDYEVWSLWVNNQQHPCVLNRTGVRDVSWGNLTLRAPTPYNDVLTSLDGPNWRKPFPGQWIWNQHPFSIGNCLRDRRRIPELIGE